jgi:large subunit ribosomal protein L21
MSGDGKGEKENMFAVIKSGGKQYKVSVGQRLEVDRQAVEVGKQVQFDKVLLISDEANIMVGSPLVEDAMVLATATEHARGKKLIVFKYKPKKRYRHRRGHRQELTIFSIDDIVAGGKSLLTGEAPKFQQEEEETPAEVEETTPEAAETAETAETAESTETPAEGEAEAQAAEVTEPQTEKKPSRRRRVKKTDDTEHEEEE